MYNHTPRRKKTRTDHTNFNAYGSTTLTTAGYNCCRRSQLHGSALHSASSSDLLVYTQKHIVVLLRTYPPPHRVRHLRYSTRLLAQDDEFSKTETQKFSRHIHTLYSLNRALFVNQSLAPAPEWKSLLAQKYSFANF